MLRAAYAQIDDIFETGLHEYLDGLQTKMNQIGSDIHDTFFAARVVPATPARAPARRTARPSSPVQ